MKTFTEADLLRQCKDYLNIKQIFYIRLNSGMFRTPTGAMYKMSEPGCPDLLICKDGVVKWIELKTKTGRQGGSQKIFQKRLEKAGGQYFLVRSIEELISILI